MLRRRLLLSLACTTALAASSGCATTSNPPLFEQPSGTEVPPAQDAKLAAYNVAFGALVGGAGALINGAEGRPLHRLARGAGWGAVGGTVAYFGKWQAGEVAENDRLAYALPARLLHDAGLSVVENAAHDRPPFDRFATHLGVLRLDVRPGSGAVQARLLPVHTLTLLRLLADGNADLDVERSLAYGGAVFIGDLGRDLLSRPLGSGRHAYGAVVISRPDQLPDFHGTAAHELVHVMQYSEFGRAEAALRTPLDPLLSRSGAYRAVSRWIYLDGALLTGLVSWATGVPADYGFGPCKYNNWLEREAEAFGRRRPVEVCP